MHILFAKAVFTPQYLLDCFYYIMTIMLFLIALFLSISVYRIIGQVAVTGSHQWISADEHATSLCSSFQVRKNNAEFPEFYQSTWLFLDNFFIHIDVGLDSQDSYFSFLNFQSSDRWNSQFSAGIRVSLITCSYEDL